MNLRDTLERFVGRTPPARVAVLRLEGAIGMGGARGLSLARLAGPLEAAFKAEDCAAVALILNSPGGSAAQSALIGNRIRALADEHKKPVYAYVEDVAASGGYWLACAADEIVADANSVVGSIGVIAAGFGFAEAIARLGVERRLYTAGHAKSLLDPFLPAKQEDVDRLKALQAEIHANFIAWVRNRRGTRLAGDDATLFEGAFWTGAQAKQLGLVDALGDARSDLRRRFGEKVRYRRFGARDSALRRWIGLAQSASFGTENAAWPQQALEALETRSLWARYGL
ncbi:MAG: S49 family peptidase [Telmatospirillum sp.]|nr:S49 family peptidase [Telmatospirillum sp.]